VNALAAAPPAAAIAAARNGIARLQRAGAGVFRTDPERAAALHLSLPHRVYWLLLDEAARGCVSANAQPVGWRFILIDEAEALAAVEVRERGEADFVFSAANYGPFVAATVEAVRRLEHAGLALSGEEPRANRNDDSYPPSFTRRPAAAGRDGGAGEAVHELRLLRFPAMYLEALWLHGEGERFMPLAPTPGGLDAFRIYPEPEFSRLVSTFAASRGPGPALAP
jgi:hypothetical protein